MAVQDFADIRTKVRYRTQDTAGRYWPDAELDAYINDAQLDFARLTRCLRKELPIIQRANSEVYDFPEDFLEFIRMTNQEGEDVSPKTWQWLRDNYGETFMDTTATNPTHLYADLAERGKFRFYPKPDPSATVSGTTVTNDAQEVATVTGYASVPFQGGLAYASNSQLWYYHPETGTRLIANVAVLWLAANDLYIFGLDNSAELYRFNLGGTINHGTLPAGTYQGKGMCALTGGLSTACTVASTTQTWMNIVPDSGAITSSEITFNADSRSAQHVAVGYIGSAQEGIVFSIGVTHRIYKTDVLSVIAGGDVGILFSEETGSITSDDPVYVSPTVSVSLGSGYFAKGSATGISIYSDDTVGTRLVVPEADMPVSGITKWVTSATDRTKVYFAGTDAASVTCVYVFDTVAETVTKLLDTTDTTTLQTLTGAALLDGTLFVDGTTTTQYVIAQWVSECGDVVYVDAEAFASDAGIVTDIAEATDITLFDGDAGGVTQWIDGQNAVTLWYAREPQSDTLDIDNAQALVFYVAWQCFMKESDMQNFAKAAVWQREYQREVDRENRRRAQGYLGSTAAARATVQDF